MIETIVNGIGATVMAAAWLVWFWLVWTVVRGDDR